MSGKEGGCGITTENIDQLAQGRALRTLAAYVRQELSAPAVAIMGYAEMLVDDAVQAKGASLTTDLRRILDASRALNRLIADLLNPAAIQKMQGNAEPAAYHRTLRHELRTPINAIKGYGEMLREDAADGGADAFVADLDRLLEEANLLLARIDGLVTFSGGATSSREGAAPVGAEAGAPARMVESLLSSVRPITALDADLAAVRPSRILVVDDNASNRDLLSRRLQRQGHTVLQAEDGTAALTLVEKEPVDLALLDLMMPGISGYDVLVAMKSDPRFQDIPVIMISALTELDSVVRCIEAGADDYLAKPFDPTLLRARVGSSLEKKFLRDREREIVEALRIEKERSEQLLLNILPKEIVARLNGGETIIANRLPNVTILFADIVGFTRLSARLSAEELVRLLNSLFSEFDRLALDLGVEKIKTLGDAYMVAGGVPEPRADHADAVADLALAMLATIRLMSDNLPEALQMRIGIHSGDVVAGIIGTHKFVYDIWGDAVNIASRMESHSLPNRIQVSAVTYEHLRKRFRLEPNGRVNIQGKGPMETYFLLGRADGADE